MTDAEPTIPSEPAAPTVVPEVDAPVAVETPAVETPAVETPAVETPAVETPAVETPAPTGREAVSSSGARRGKGSGGRGGGRPPRGPRGGAVLDAEGLAALPVPDELIRFNALLAAERAAEADAKRLRRLEQAKTQAAAALKQVTEAKDATPEDRAAAEQAYKDAVAAWQVGASGGTAEADDTSTGDASTADAPAGDTPTDAGAQDEPADEVAAPEAPTAEMPAEEAAPTDEVPVDEVPTPDAPQPEGDTDSTTEA